MSTTGDTTRPAPGTEPVSAPGEPCAPPVLRNTEPMKPISRTAFYTAGVRMLDARKRHPICGDHYAERFMDSDAQALLAQFRSFRNANQSNVCRHRMIDDVLREKLKDHPDRTVVLIGAGFDSRAYRVTGGRWIEVDEPELMRYKESCLPSSGCPNPLTRIPIEFATESLESKLAEFATPEEVVIVIEGVFMYLEPQSVISFLQTLKRLFPRHLLVCDLMTKGFFDRFVKAIHAQIEKLGATFKWLEERPEQFFVRNGYRLETQQSVIERSFQEFPFLLRPVAYLMFPRKHLMGVSICCFRTPATLQSG